MHDPADISQTRIGQLLVKKNLLSQAQLLQALEYQSKHKVKIGTALTDLNLVSPLQITRILRKQKILRLLAGGIALSLAPNSLVADENIATKIAHSNYTSSTNLQNLKTETVNSARSMQVEFNQKPVDNDSKEFYFTGDQDHLMSLNKNVYENASIQLSLFNAKQPLFSNHYEYQFEPQISLYSFSSRDKAVNYSPTKRLGPGLDRASNTKPVIYMLTLKGRCLYENSGNQTTMWSLDSAKKGVQRKAELMFSITKHF